MAMIKYLQGFGENSIRFQLGFYNLIILFIYDIQCLHYANVAASFFFLQANDKRLSPMCYGPAENSHVANYKMAITNFPLSLERKKWSKVETENLVKGIRQQFQAMVLQISRDHTLECTAIARCTHQALGLILTTYICTLYFSLSGVIITMLIVFLFSLLKDKKYFQHLQPKLHIFFFPIF